MSPANTILVVDDEANLRRSLSLILQKSGYSVTSAANGEEAIQYLQSGAYDLAFLDLKMPDTNGMELLPEIRNMYPDMPVLILTAHATLESAIEAVRKGARDYMIKPIDPPVILSRVDSILAEQRQPKRRREIVSHIQELLGELRQIDGQEPSSPGILMTVSSTDPTRFLQRGPLTLDLHARHIKMGEQFIQLSPTAFDYLVTLLRHSPNPVSYETLVMESQGYKTSLNEARDLARWRIHELRKALEPKPEQPMYIITERGTGYRLVI
ncbi:MAG: DNA-binding response regulator [Chloroflexi bacterium]|nr:MAG: DNA-binding response regulator [Chloroflexota bacterium]